MKDDQAENMWDMICFSRSMCTSLLYEESEVKKKFAFLNGIIKWLLGI